MMNSKIYIHGRPKGQDVWPSTDGNLTDSQYLSSFLDSKFGSDVKSLMIIDVLDNSSYYTYVHRHNVYEYERSRKSAYFAITICLRGLMSVDVYRIYDLLNLVYEQKCLNFILEERQDGEVFLVESLDKVEKSLENNIVSIINRNLEKVLSSSFVSLPSSYSTKSSDVRTYALTDVNSPSFFSDFRNHKLLISPYYLTKDENLKAIENERCQVEQKYSVCRGKCSELEKEVELWKSKVKNESPNTSSPTNSKGVLEENRKLKEENERLKTENESLIVTISELQTETVRQSNSNDLSDDNVVNYVGYLTKKIKWPEWLILFNSFVLCLCVLGAFNLKSTIQDVIKGSSPSEQVQENLNSPKEAAPLYKMGDAINYLYVKGLFKESRESNNQNINIINGSSSIKLSKKGCKVGLIDSMLISGFDPALGKWDVQGASFIIDKSNTIIPQKKGKSTIVFKYNGIKVLQREITIVD